MDWKLFKNPPKEYRAKPFWALNGKLEKKHLKFQIECMKKMGFGGAFLHSRTGLVTEYMSDEWMALLDYAVKILHENGMDAYLYDEDRWPSGTCGGLVTQTKEFRGKGMVYEEIADGSLYVQPENFLALFAVTLDNGKAKTYRKIAHPSDANGNERVFCFYYIYMQADSFYNGYTYVDTMNLAATKRFIEFTHEYYRKKMGDKFGKQIVGIFTDEPHRGPYLNGFSRKEEKAQIEIPYTYDLFDEFTKRKGYAIEERLPVLWFGKADEEFCKEAYDLIEVEQQLFLERYAKPYYKWCKKYNLIVTGHILHEDNLAAQTTMCGSVMRYYEYMDYPGMDNLGERNYTYNVPKLVASAARQLGKEFVLDELYGCTGWQMRFDDYKHTGDWQSATGVTLRCPHLSWYTMKGQAKRDYPASILHQSAWYKYYAVVEDYFARMHYLLKNGEPLTDTAIINPIQSTWGLTDQTTYKNYFAVTSPLYQKIEREYSELYKDLLFFGADVDYIDEGLFRAYGKVENGLFCCGKVGYKKIILNGNINLDGHTVSALNAFLAQGGKVIVVGDMPCYKDGEKYDFEDALKGAQRIPFDTVKAYELIKDSELEVETGASRLIVTKRKMQEGYVVLLLNPQKEENLRACVRIKTPLSCIKLNLRTGEEEYVDCRRMGEYLMLDKMFAGGEELALLLSDKELPAPKEYTYEEVPMPRMYTFATDEENCLVLDKAEYAVDGEWQGVDYVLNIDECLRRKWRLEVRHGEMIQPWFKEKYLPSQDKKYGRVALRYEFFVRAKPQTLSLMVEDAKTLTVTLNGVAVETKRPKASKIDNAFDVVTLPVNALKNKENVLEISFDFYEKTNVEACYLLGDFGVNVGGRVEMIADAKWLSAGDFTKQGFPYFGGRMVLMANVPNGHYRLQTDEMLCALARINGETLAFSPYQTEFDVVDGVMRIELAATRNNMFGCADGAGEHTRILPFGLSTETKLFKRN